MSWETYIRIIDQVRGHTRGERFSISYSGMGEPLLNPLLFRFVRHVADQAVTSFASNGAALTENNVRKLIDSGLDTIYLSFNGDDAESFSRMMGGLSYDQVLGNVRRAVALAEGTRLKLRANVSITKANQDRVSRIKAQLEHERIEPVTFSLCHSRGGNLRDPTVCDTPPMQVDHWACDVMKNTLFVDWQGRARICDHDLHGEYELGDLMTEPLAVILERRQKLLEDSSGLKICRQCNDVMRVGGTFPLASRAGGVFRDWLYYLYQDLADPLSEANEPMKWIFQIYQKEGRADRFVNRLLAIEKSVQAELSQERNDRAVAAGRTEGLARERDAVVRELQLLQSDRQALAETKDRLQATLDERDRQFAALHADYVAIRRSWTWRLGQMVQRDIARLTRWLQVNRTFPRREQ